MADLFTIQEARRQIIGSSVPTGELANDALVQLYVDAVTEMIVSRSSDTTEADRAFVASGGRSALLLPRVFASVVSVVEDGATVDPSLYAADGRAGIIYRTSGVWSAGVMNITATVHLGVAVTPAAQKLAALETFRDLWRIRQGPRPAMGQPGGDAVPIPAGYALPNRAVELLWSVPSLPGFA